MQLFLVPIFAGIIIIIIIIIIKRLVWYDFRDN